MPGWHSETFTCCILLKRFCFWVGGFGISAHQKRHPVDSSKRPSAQQASFLGVGCGPPGSLRVNGMPASKPPGSKPEGMGVLLSQFAEELDE